MRNNWNFFLQLYKLKHLRIHLSFTYFCPILYIRDQAWSLFISQSKMASSEICGLLSGPYSWYHGCGLPNWLLPNNVGPFQLPSPLPLRPSPEARSGGSQLVCAVSSEPPCRLRKSITLHWPHFHSQPQRIVSTTNSYISQIYYKNRLSHWKK